MLEIVLTYPTEEGSEKIFIESEKTSFGRGSDALHRFEDNGLSRLHATIYREDNHIWIVDENSSNGTFVNGQKVTPSGTPLENGDVIKIGNHTNLKVKISETEDFQEDYSQDAQSNSTQTNSVSSKNEEKTSILFPLAITAFALLIVGASIVLIGVLAFGNSGRAVVQNQQNNNPEGNLDDDDPFAENNSSNENNDDSNSDLNTTTTPSNQNTSTENTNDDDTNLTNSPEANTDNPEKNLPRGKRYQQMSAGEKNQYVKIKSERVARIIGNNSSESIPPAAVSKIKYWLDGYVRRIGSGRSNKCTGKNWFTDDMKIVLGRAKENAPFIIRAFNKKGIDAQIGLYLAMIESEHCPCLQSYTGPLGMFQFTQDTGRRFGLRIVPGATPSNPDQRCEPKPASNAAAAYMKSLTGRIGTGPLSVPLAIASYNSGEGNLAKNLRAALESTKGKERSFWTLVINAEKLNKQFRNENIKYVPKFFAAAIIGENPKDFGINMHPISTYTN